MALMCSVQSDSSVIMLFCQNRLLPARKSGCIYDGPCSPALVCIAVLGN